jgi:hypothetical protein
MAPHRYDVHICEPLADIAKPSKPGEPTPEHLDLLTSVEALSPEAAVEVARSRWRQKYSERAPADAEVIVTRGPDVCPRCAGRGWLPWDVSPDVADSGADRALGSESKRTCPDCLGSGERR